MTKIYLFEYEFQKGTQNRCKNQRGRVFARHTILHVGRVNSSEIRLLYIETIGKKNQGHASDALSWLCEMADFYDLTICLCPVACEEGLTVVQLTAWYQRYGFVRIGMQDEMRRFPNATKH